MQFEHVRVDREASATYFVYPFLFNSQEFEQRSSAITAATFQSEQQAIPIWEQDKFSEEDLLAHVAQYLNSTHSPTARLWKLQNSNELRKLLGINCEWFLVPPQKPEIAFEFGQRGQGSSHIKLALFKIGVGFLTVQVQPQSEALKDWLDFIHYFRFLKKKRGVQIRSQKSVGYDKKNQQKQYEPFFPDFAGGLAQSPEGKGTLDKIITALLETGKFRQNARQWWQEVFIPGQMFPFVSLFVDSIEEDDIPHLLYKTRNFFHFEQGQCPAPEDLALNHPNLLSYAKNQWFVMSIDGGSFVGCNTPEKPFFRSTLPSHLSNEYFLLFLLALHQRFTLMMLSFEVAQHWVLDPNSRQEKQRQKAFEHIRDRLLSFTARGYFYQAMQREHHHRCYLKWQEVFQIEQLYQEVRDEVQEMHEYTIQRSTERVENKLNLLGIFLGIPGLIIGILGINIRGHTAGDDGMVLGVALMIGLGGGLCLAFLVWLVLKYSE